MESYGWFKEEYNKAKNTPEFKQETFDNKVHPKYLPYYQYAKMVPGCDIECGECGQFVSCGPVPDCLKENNKLPCKNCFIWIDSSLPENYIDENVNLMKYVNLENS